MYQDTENLLTPQAEPLTERQLFFKQVATAIREGIKIRPKQCFNAQYRRHDYSCAFGAAMDSGQLLVDAPGWRYFVPYPCQPCYQLGAARWGRGQLMLAIVHLNDEHRWTRERIADWLDTLD